MDEIEFKGDGGVVLPGGWSAGDNPMTLWARGIGARRWTPAARVTAIAIAGSMSAWIAIWLQRGSHPLLPSVVAVPVVLMACDALRIWMASMEFRRCRASGVLRELVATPVPPALHLAGFVAPWQQARAQAMVAFFVLNATVGPVFLALAGARPQGVALALSCIAFTAAHALSLRRPAYWTGHDEIVRMVSPPSIGRSVRGAVLHGAAMWLLVPAATLTMGCAGILCMVAPEGLPLFFFGGVVGGTVLAGRLARALRAMKSASSRLRGSSLLHLLDEILGRG